VKVQVPQAVDVSALVTADLPLLEAVLGGLGARAVRGTPPRALAQTVGLEETPDRRVGGGRTQLGLLLGAHGQVVGVQLIAPMGMLPMLGGQQFPQPRAQGGVLAGVGTDLAPQRRHRILLRAPGGVVPAFDRGATPLDTLTGDRMTPGPGRQLIQLGLELTALGGSRQQRTDHAEAQVRPLLVGTREGRGFRHGQAGLVRIQGRSLSLPPVLPPPRTPCHRHPLRDPEPPLLNPTRGGTTQRSQEPEQVQKAIAPLDFEAQAQ